MTKNTIVKEVAEQRIDVEHTRARLQEKRAAAEHIRTPVDVCREYSDLVKIRETTVNKKRKDADRKIATMKEQHKYIVEDSALLDRIKTMELDLLTKQMDLDATEKYLKTQTDTICQILVDYEIVSASSVAGRNEYQLMEPLGKIASQLAEVHPIPLAELIVHKKWFAGWSARQIVGLLSVFTDVRVPEDQRSNAPRCDDERVLSAIQNLEAFYSEVRGSELGQYLHTGISYEGALCYDMADLMMEWCGLTEESECKRFLTENCVSVSAGDFAKACMKLSATAKELIAMCESFPGEAGPTEFAHTLTGVDALILKHIATTQSLYL